MKIDGKKIAESILRDLQKKVGKLNEKNIAPKLAIILIGHDPASLAYVRQKELKAKSIGVKTLIKHLSLTISESALVKTVRQFNNDSSVHGIIVQQPLLEHISTEAVIKTIDPKKDVDGFSPKSKFETPIAQAVLKILKEIYFKRGVQIYHLRGGVAPQSNVAGTFDVPPAAHLGGEFKKWLKNKKIVIIGKGETGGKPIIEMFKKMSILPVIIDSKTMNYELLTKHADIIISAVGKPRIVTADQIKKGVILISVGLFREKDGKLHGDYEEDEMENLASFYTPTPGGVGPVNVAMLLKNLIIASEN